MGILEIDGISKRFGGVVAVDNFSMTLDRNQIVGIIGPNGAGKTTIFNLISGVYDVDSGDIKLEGKDITNLPQEQISQRGIARTFQNIRLFNSLSVLDNVKISCDKDSDYKLFGALFKTKRARKGEVSIEEEAYRYLELVNLDKYADEKPGSLPYGLQRHLEIARALALKPKVMLLDEPAAGLNPEEVVELIKFIRNLKEDHNLPIIIIEHKMDVIMQLCDYIYVQDFGNTIASGTPSEIQTNPAVISAYLGEEEIC